MIKSISYELGYAPSVTLTTNGSGLPVIDGNHTIASKDCYDCRYDRLATMPLFQNVVITMVSLCSAYVTLAYLSAKSPIWEPLYFLYYISYVLKRKDLTTTLLHQEEGCAL